ncbi:MAG: M1 family aminopeptidase, partial [Longimicrobiales bacterium]|nr:M1 family aminopeptidase [Longimicrobiales bacterium]
EDYLYTLFVPDRAHAALPLFDQPDLKARFRLELEVPDGWRAISNGPVVGVETAEGGGSRNPADPRTLADPGTSDDARDPGARGAGDATLPGDEGTGGRRTYRFGETEPIPTYLFAFAAGRFEREDARRDGRSMVFHHRETDSVRIRRNRDDLFDLHATALEWLEEYTGIPEPFGHFGFVAVPGFQYNGMEHPGALYYRASSLFLDESTTQAELLGRASVIAHETAHLWFGDLVTMEWFDDVWMKEVFANFMAARIVHPSFPELNHDLRFFLSHHPAAYSVDRTAGAHPIRQELENLNEAGSLYGPVIYQKAPIVMRQLELLLGEEALRDGLREYLDRHRFGNASWPDLVDILDPRTPVDLTAWSRIWMEEAGRPVVRTTLALRDGDVESPADGRTVGAPGSTPLRPVIERLTVVQEDPAGRGRTWPQTLHVVLGYGNDSTVALPVQLLEEEADVDGARGLPRPDWVLPGGRGLGYGRFALDPASRARLLETLPRNADPLVRGVGWVALWEELLDGTVGPEPFMDAVLEALRREEVELNLQRILGYVGAVWWRVFDDIQRERWAARVEEVLWSGVQGEDPRTHRAAFFRTYRSVAVTPEGVDRLRDLWRGETEIADLALSVEDRTQLASELALRGVGVTPSGMASDSAASGAGERAAVEELLDRQLESIENPDRRERFQFIRPSLSADPSVREAFFESLRNEEGRRREPWVATAVSNLHHPLRARHGRRFILPSLELLEEIRRTGDIFFVTAWLDATLWGHGSPEAASTVREFLAERSEYPERIRQKVLQSADLLFRVAGGRE